MHLLYISLLAKQLENYMLPCFIKKITGIDCPGCGLQRAFLFFVQGDFKAAFLMYPAIYPLFLLALLLTFHHFYAVKYFNKLLAVLLIGCFFTNAIHYIC